MDVGLESMKYKIQSQYYISPLSFEGRLCKMVALISVRLRRQVNLSLLRLDSVYLLACEPLHRISAAPPAGRPAVLLRQTLSDRSAVTLKTLRVPLNGEHLRICSVQYFYFNRVTPTICIRKSVCRVCSCGKWVQWLREGAQCIVAISRKEMKIMSVWWSENHSYCKLILKCNISALITPNLEELKGD